MPRYVQRDGSLGDRPVSRGHAAARVQRFRGSAEWKRIAAAQIARQPWCSRCGHRGSADNRLTADHIVPLAAGGHPTRASNLQTLCHRCNSGKRDRIPDYRRPDGDEVGTSL